MEKYWTVDWYVTLRRYQRDRHSCDSFIIYIMDVIGKNEIFDLLFDSIKYRVEIALLLKEQEDMKKF